MKRKLVKKVALLVVVCLCFSFIPADMIPGYTVRVAAAEEESEYPELFVRAGSTYGYSLLPKRLQGYYDSLLLAMRNVVTGNKSIKPDKSVKKGETYYFADSVTVEGVASLSEVEQVWRTFEQDHPEFYWLDGCSFSMTGDEAVFMPLVVKSYSTDNARDLMDAIILKEASGYLETAEAGKDVYEKVRILHDRLIDTIEYAMDNSGNADDSKDTHSIVGAFNPDMHRAVCEGYCKAFAFLLNVLEIPQVYVTGMTGSEGHAWNVVSFDGGKTYYDIDITWDDCGSDDFSPLRYDYFAMNDILFSLSHQAFDKSSASDMWQYALPTLGKDDNMTYFRHYGTEMYQYSSENWLEKTRAAMVKAPGDVLYILISDESYSSYARRIGYLGSYAVWEQDEYTQYKNEIFDVMCIKKGSVEKTVYSDATVDTTGGSNGNSNVDVKTVSYDDKTEETVVESQGSAVIGTKVTDGNSGAVYQVTAGRTVTYLSPRNQKVTSITVPDTLVIDGISYKVTSISKNACRGMKKLKKVTLGRNVKKIGKRSFYNCKKLKSVTVRTTKLKKTSLGKKAFFKILKKCTFYCPKKKKKVYKKYFQKAGAVGKYRAI